MPMISAYLMALIGSTFIAVTSNDPYLEWLSKGGVVGILALGIVAFLRGWIISGAEHKRVISERDRLQEIVYRHAELSEKAMDAAMDRLALEEQLARTRRN